MSKPSGRVDPRGALDAGNMSTCVTGARCRSAGIETQGIMPHDDGHVKERHGTDHPICVDRS